MKKYSASTSLANVDACSGNIGMPNKDIAKVPGFRDSGVPGSRPAIDTTTNPTSASSVTAPPSRTAPIATNPYDPVAGS